MKRAFSVITLLFLFANANANADTLTFGVVPQQSASKLAKLWAPICKRLSDVVGHDIVFKTAKNIPEFEKRLAAGEYDIAYMNPYHYTVFSAQAGYRALAKARDKQIRGIVVVRKDGQFKGIEDFNDNTLAFPAPAAFAASMLPRAEFQRRGINITPQYVSSHDSVYRAVAKGLYPAGGGVMRTFKNVDPAIREKLEVLWTTDPYTPHAIATHPAMSSDKREKILKALTDFESDPAGLKLLGSIKLKGFIPAQDSDWDDVRSLDFDTKSLTSVE